MKNKKPTVFILGKLPPPYFGPSIAKEIILNSVLLNEKYRLIHVDTRLNKKISDLGEVSIAKIFKVISIYFRFLLQLLKYKPEIILVPVGQETIAFIKDSFFIFFGRMTGSKVLIHLRGSNWLTWQKKSSSFTRGFTKMMLKFCYGVIVLGENLRYLFKPYFKEKNIFVVPNGGNYIFAERQY
jgi:hypothetical protein